MNSLANIDLSSPIEIKAYLSEQQAGLEERFFETSIETLQNQRAMMFDDLIIALWQYHQLDTIENLSLNAVGGYGRQTLHPKSDIDICILFDKSLPKAQETNLSAFLTHLWDLGVDIGHAVRSIKENINAAKTDITIATNLLDIRTLVGQPEQAKHILEALYNNSLWNSQKFCEHKLLEQDDRHDKAKNTALYLEPNVKNNPGGMRDVQTIIWIARKHYNVADVQSLKSLGVLKPDEYYELIESYDFICRIRWALHMVSNRAEEKLLFDSRQQIKKDEKRIKFLFEDLKREQDELQAFAKMIDEKIIQAEEAVKVLKLEKQSAAEQTEALNSIEKRTGTVDEVADNDLNRRVKVVKNWFKDLEPEQAAKYLKEFAERGDMAFVAKLLDSLEDRRVAKVLAAFDDAPLVAKIVDTFTKKDRAADTLQR